ncbi:iron-sulfur cluster carrier protein ApbC [Novispirillum sp. DQ9]|uniref:iron-sulfur cluster carrier protein ApbC n=1 Tax=Novispirillum sp. DQ9 TaxID=3398612 RepID=UPI003C7B890B
MAGVTKEQVVEVLRGIIHADSGSDIVSAGWIGEVVVKDGHVTFAIEVPPQLAPELEPVRKAAEQAVFDMPGVLSCTAVLTAPREPGQGASAGAPPGAPQHGGAMGQQELHGKMVLPHVKHIIAVASGKGGVGKSTTSANLALALSRLGLKVGLFDADIYGPSVPRMMGLSGLRPAASENAILPMENHGLKIMSIGFMVPEDAPVIWRGPMVIGALEQLLRDVDWGDLDVMVVDMPPGTGDTQLTMSQRVPLAGAVIVSTPQDIALLDARKGLNMFRKVEVPVLGMIENMSYHVCTNCGHREDVFSHGGARKTAEELNTDFLGEIPLDIKIRETADGGAPIVISDPDSPHSKAYMEIARKIWDKLQAGSRKAGPTIKVH